MDRIEIRINLIKNGKKCHMDVLTTSIEDALTSMKDRLDGYKIVNVVKL